MSATATKAATTTTAASAVVITSFPVIPLTTTFTPHADCSGFYEPSIGIFMVDPMTSCLPTGLNLAPTAYFSPGIICPSGYAEACHDTRGVSTITTVTCCPVRGDVSLSCVNTSSLAGAFTTLFCTWNPDSTASISVTLSADDGITSTSLFTLTSPAGVNAYGVRMVYESTDLAALSTSSSSKSPIKNSASTTPTISSTTTSSTTSPTGSAAASKGTSAGTIAAAVIVPIVVLALLGGLFMWWRRQRKPKGDYTTHELNATTPKWYNGGRSELPTEGPRAEVKRGEMSDFREPAELPVYGG